MSTNRVKESDLGAIVARINRVTNSPATGWTTSADGHNVSNVGNYHLDGAYGGWALYRISNASGGCSDVLNSGHVSKRELQSLMFAYIQGLQHTEE